MASKYHADADIVENWECDVEENGDPVLLPESSIFCGWELRMGGVFTRRKCIE